MNSLTIAGTIGRNAELRRTQAGDPICSFPVVVDNGKDKNGQKRDGTWFDCSIWGKRGEALERYLLKGGKVTIQGRVGMRVHESKGYLQVNVSEITLQGGRTDDTPRDVGYEAQKPLSQDDGFGDEIPF